MFDTDEIQWQFQMDACLDAVQVVQNPFFDSDTDWDLIDGADISPFTSFVTMEIGSSFAQTLTTETAGWYEININVNLSSDNTSQGKLIISGFATQFEVPAQRGRYTFYGQALAASTDLSVLFSAVSGAGSVAVNEFTARLVEYPDYEFIDINGDPIADTANQFDEGNYSTWSLVPSSNLLAAGYFRIRVFRTCGGEEISWTSEPICIVPQNQSDILLSGCGNMNSFGSDFQPLMRLSGELMRGTGYQYPNRYVYQDSGGSFYNGYTRRNKSYTLKIDLIPEHVRDFVYMSALYNSLAVKIGEGTQVNLFLEDEPDDPVFPDGEKDLATVTLRMVEKAANVVSKFNRDCTRALPPTVIGENAIERAIQTDTDELIQA